MYEQLNPLQMAIRSFQFALCLAILITLSWSNSAFAQVGLKAKVPALCYECHKKLKKGLSDKYVHFLFKQGKCITCHNSHVSKVKGLMSEEIDTVCLNCHEEVRTLIKNTTLHSALRDNNCTECHSPHSGKNRHLLVKKERELCLGCHEDLNKKFNDPFACLPFKQGKCSACHDSHASAQEDLLISAPVKLCVKCHKPRCRINGVSIASAVAKTDCTTCHTGHSSKEKGLLGPYGHKVFLGKKCVECHNPIKSGRKITTKIKGSDLCVNCHKKEQARYKYVDNNIHVKNAGNPCTVCHDYHASGKKNLTKKESRLCAKCHEDTEKRTAAMEKGINSVKCAPIKERKCFECHLPAHSDRPLDFRADEIPLCAKCHASQHKITHPLGTDVKDPRDGKALTCNSCHSMHSANADYMLTHDRKRALCIQCHKM